MDKAKEIEPSSIISHVFLWKKSGSHEMYDSEPEKTCKIVLTF